VVRGQELGDRTDLVEVRDPDVHAAEGVALEERVRLVSVRWLHVVESASSAAATDVR
jgi:hypothetical protein